MWLRRGGQRRCPQSRRTVLEAAAQQWSVPPEPSVSGQSQPRGLRRGRGPLSRTGKPGTRGGDACEADVGAGRRGFNTRGSPTTPPLLQNAHFVGGEISVLTATPGTNPHRRAQASRRSPSGLFQRETVLAPWAPTFSRGPREGYSAASSRLSMLSLQRGRMCVLVRLISCDQTPRRTETPTRQIPFGSPTRKSCLPKPATWQTFHKYQTC